ncbi:hypothetical protein BDZ89DRAFT_529231 [Hymenopellis radicata]|nr:hypothetical protein BDZ89DRAFT_529231 [Hymenopellis radicata]
MIFFQCGTQSDAAMALERLPETTCERINDLLASNMPPLGHERESLSDLMSRTQDHVNSLETRIAELHATLLDLTTQKVVAEKRLGELNVILHPIRTVPPEILAEIFEEAVSDSALIPLERVREGNFANSVDVSSQSCIVSYVSSGWRRTALRTPRLWRFIHVCFDQYPRNLATSLFLNRFLARSAEHMLHVMFHGTMDHPAMAVLLMASSRWRTAAVSLPPPVYYSWDAPNLSFCSLATCHLHVQLNGINGLQTAPEGHTRVNLDAPQLQAFSSDTAGVWSQLIKPRFPRLERFEQIGALDEHLSPCGVSFVAPLVMASTQLSMAVTSAVFHVEKAVPDMFYARVLKRPIRDSYPTLRVLRLRGTSTGYRHFFSKFTLPRLELLSFEDTEGAAVRTFHPRWLRLQGNT